MKSERMCRSFNSLKKAAPFSMKGREPVGSLSIEERAYHRVQG